MSSISERKAVDVLLERVDSLGVELIRIPYVGSSRNLLDQTIYVVVYCRVVEDGTIFNMRGKSEGADILAYEVDESLDKSGRRIHGSL